MFSYVTVVIFELALL